MTPRRSVRSACPAFAAARALLVMGAFASTLTLAPAATAQKTSSAAIAESLFVEARELMAEGNYAAACPKLRESHELDPQLGTLLNLGKCHEQNGQSASAWATFTELSRLASRAGQTARADYAAERVQALAPTLAYVTVRLSSPVPDSSVRIDEEILSTAVLGSALPVDPGMHRITVEAPDHQPWTQDIEVTPSSRQEVVVPALTPVVTEPEPPPQAPTPVLPPAAPAPVPMPLPVAPPSDSPSSPWWPVAITSYAVAGAGVFVGAVTGGFALDAGGSLDCPMGACPPSEANELSRANTLANVANVSFAIAGAGAVLGIIATVIAADDDPSHAWMRGGKLRF